MAYTARNSGGAAKKSYNKGGNNAGGGERKEKKQLFFSSVKNENGEGFAPTAVFVDQYVESGAVQVAIMLDRLPAADDKGIVRLWLNEAKAQS